MPSQRAQKVMTFIGAFIMLLPNSVTSYWGNVSVYVYSYFHHKNNSAPHLGYKTPWLLSMFTISFSSAIVICGYINNKIGKRASLILAIAVTECGLISSYFVFAESMKILDLTMGILCGFGSGLMHATLLQIIVEWINSHLGLVTALLFMSYAIGAIITNQVITHYLNPENQKVDIIIGKMHYFSQEDILNKVPYMFLALSTASGLLHLIGFFMIRIRKSVKNIKLKDRNSTTNNEAVQSKPIIRLPESENDNAVQRIPKIQLPETADDDSKQRKSISDLPGSVSLPFPRKANLTVPSTTSLHLPRTGSFHLPRKGSFSLQQRVHLPRSSSLCLLSQNESSRRYDKTSSMDPRMDALSRLVESRSHQKDYMTFSNDWFQDDNRERPRSISFTGEMDWQRNDTLLDSLENTENEKTPTEVLKSRFFYVIWFTIIGADGAFICLSNYYKVFGQIWIKDDHFLTNLGTTSAAFTSVMRIFWGIMTDYVSIKPALVTLTTGLSLITTTYYFTPLINKWVFFFVNMGFSCMYCGVYVNFVVAMRSLYGRVNFTKNYGMLASATIILNTAFPPLAKIILTHFGWFWLFVSLGFLNFFSLLYIVVVLAD